MPDRDIAQMVADIIADGKMTNVEKKELDTFLLADGKLSVEERQHIDKLLMLIARGELTVEQ